MFSDPGGAKPILALVYLNRIKNCKLISDRHYDFFSDFNLNVEAYKLDKEQSIINEYKPDYIFTGTSYTSNIELKFISEGNNLNVKTYSFVDHYTNFINRFYLNDKYIFPDEIFLTDQRALILAKKAGLNKNSKIQISGNFYHEYLTKWEPKLSKNNFFSNIGVDYNKRIIVFAPDPLSNLNGENVFSFDESDVWKDLSTALSNVFIDNPPILIVKYHPNQNINYLKKAIKKFPVNNYFCTDSIDTNTLIYHADIVIGMFSNILIEAKIFNKKILRHLPNSELNDPLKQSKVGHVSNDLEGLARNLKLFK